MEPRSPFDSFISLVLVLMGGVMSYKGQQLDGIFFVLLAIWVAMPVAKRKE